MVSKSVTQAAPTSPNEAAFKDFFSEQAAVYQQFRPQYPAALFEYLRSWVTGDPPVWDCATGNGQAAQGLATCFSTVIATDASAAQINLAKACAGVIYQVCPAEHSPFRDQSIGLITVAEAMHWFDLPRFYAEVARVLQPGGVLACWSYGHCHVSDAMDTVIHTYRQTTLQDYWPTEAKQADVTHYPLPSGFEAIPSPTFYMLAEWRFEQLMGYLYSWSATRRYQLARHHNPLDAVEQALLPLWGDAHQSRMIQWPMQLRISKKPVH
ncbi:class I SAM-dependent methyltransferase [Photorhabdus thracensis]|uniref:class I SAM-dependent methyltransferase n=1 Tax=Photorhabdus thracensis TaxID=230089 RepID=UPI001E53E385|nr:class I SAM-dependent methyltransferase [Photorhabdus thracensis]MCC8422604.1 class I SAM-dependent methyltransferase [Photorhabdus thracensis]